MAINQVQGIPKQKKSLTDYISDGLGVVKTVASIGTDVNSLVGGAESVTSAATPTKSIVDFSDINDKTNKMARRFKFLSQG